MIRANKFHFGFLLLLMISVVQGQDVNVAIDLPGSVNAGSDFEVRLTIDKGDLADYSRYSQELPLGLTATNVSSPNADFSFEEQRVRIIWLKLPEDDQISVVYKIHVDERLKGSFTLEGDFAYVVNEERRYSTITPSRGIIIKPNPTIDQSLIVDIKDFEKVSRESESAVSGEVFAMVIRQKPVQMSDGSVFISLLVKNPEGSKYAKIEETIPSGYIFEEVESHQGIVSFGSSQVKFIWMKLPPEPEFTISYKLIPKRGERQEAMSITGIFSYTVGNTSFEDPVVEMDANFDDLSVNDKKELLLTGTLPTGYKAKPRVDKPKVQEPETVVPNAIQGTAVLKPESGVYFRVQLIAIRKPFNGALHFSRLGIDKNIRVEKLSGLYKYTAGSFSNYVSASSYKKSILNRSGMDDAFIVAYRNGSRISIEEALQYSN